MELTCEEDFLRKELEEERRQNEMPVEKVQDSTPHIEEIPFEENFRDCQKIDNISSPFQKMGLSPNDPFTDDCNIFGFKMGLKEGEGQADKGMEDVDDGDFKDIQISPIRNLNFVDEDSRDLDSSKKEGLDMQESKDEIDNIDNIGVQEEVGCLEKRSLNQISSKISKPKL